MRVSTTSFQRALFAGLVATLSLSWACLPQDDLASYSRAWTSEPEALTPATMEPGDGGAPTPGDAASAPTGGDVPGAGAGSGATPDIDAGPVLDASVPLDAGPDAAGVDAGGAAGGAEPSIDAGDGDAGTSALAPAGNP